MNIQKTIENTATQETDKSNYTIYSPNTDINFSDLDPSLGIYNHIYELDIFIIFNR